MATRYPVGAVALLVMALAPAVVLAATPGGSGRAPGTGYHPLAGGYEVDADVVDATPHYVWRQLGEPAWQCVDVPEAGYRDRRPAEAGARDAEAAGLVGGLIGAVVGHELGHGRGRGALTVAGALLGASIAREGARRDAYRYRDHRWRPDLGSELSSARRCTEVTRTRRVREVDGYDVSYRFRGATFHKWVHEPPGDTVRIHVSVEPVDARAGSGTVHGSLTNVRTTSGDES